MSVRRIVKYAIAALAVLMILLGRQPADAQTYPNRKITIVVAFAAGGFADTMARLVAQGLGERLHESVVVENRPGAGGNIAAALVAHAPSDGYTLLATTTALAINETLMENKQFAASDLKTVAMVASSPEALATSAQNPAKSLPEFIKAMNGKVINFGSAGVGTGSQIEAEYFFKFLAKVPGAAHSVPGRRACHQCGHRRSDRHPGGHAGRRRRRADERRHHQGPRHCRRQARRRGAERVDLR